MSIRFSDISEINFTVSSVYSTGERMGDPYELFDEIKELRFVEVLNFGRTGESAWFVIRDVQEVSDGTRLVKEITAYSAEVQLQQVTVTDLEGEYRLFDPIRPHDSVMGVLIDKIPGWKIGNVDGALLTKQRTLSITQNNLYSLMVNDLAEAYEALFIFNYQDFTIDILDVTREFRNVPIFMSYDNLIKNSTVRTMTDGIITALRVHGGNLDIAGVNPNGTDTLFNVNYFKDRMSSGLLSALERYEDLFSELQTEYSDLLRQLRDQNHELTILMNSPPPYEMRFSNREPNVRFTTLPNGDRVVNSGDAARISHIPPGSPPGASPVLTWHNGSGLNQLEAAKRMLEGVKAARIEYGNIPYSDINELITQADTRIRNRTNQINTTRTRIENISNRFRDIASELRMENHFTPEQWAELNRYFIYDTLQEDSFIWTDIMTNEEKQEIQQELFDFGERALVRMSYPKFEIDIDSVNFLALEEYGFFNERFELGTTFTLDLDKYRVKPLLLEVFIDFEDLTNLKLTYANKHTLDSDFSLVEFNASNINATNSISFNLARIEAMTRQQDDVTAFINGVLDASRNELISSPSKTAITIDETGLRARSYNWSTGAQLRYEAWLTGSQLAFSDNNFASARLALGRIQNPSNPSGPRVYGLCSSELVVRETWHE